jgi:pyrroline-5-carboxylate reductase
MPVMNSELAFIGGGNMASAIIGGLLRQGMAPAHICVVEPLAEARARLEKQGVRTLAEAGPALANVERVIWAIKPQIFPEVARAARAHVGGALHLSVAAGIRSDSLAQWLGSERIVRAMPNTPALVGLGQTGLFARPAVHAEERSWVEAVMATTGAYLWVDTESLLDAVTAISGSGPAYVFYFIEALVAAGEKMGLSAAQAHQLAVGTFVGAATLAQQSDEPPAVLRERVTSKGGTTYAALTQLEAQAVGQAIAQAAEAARARAQELGDAFGN